MQRYGINGRLIPLSENGVPQIGIGESVNIHAASHDVYLAEDVKGLADKLDRERAEHTDAAAELGDEIESLRSRLDEALGLLREIAMTPETYNEDASFDAIDKARVFLAGAVERGSSIDDVTPKEPPPMKIPDGVAWLVNERTLGLDQLDAPGGPKPAPKWERHE